MTTWKERIKAMFSQLKPWDQDSSEVLRLMALVKEVPAQEDVGQIESRNAEVLIKLFDLVTHPSTPPVRSREEIMAKLKSYENEDDPMYNIEICLLEWVLNRQ